MPKKGKEKLDEELEKSLKDIVKSCEDEDKVIRQAMMRQWKKNEEFWAGNQFLFWSARDNTWISPTDLGFGDDSWSDEDMEDIVEQLGSFSDKVVDIFKGHGESIISALAAQIPAIRFIPDDADDIQDLLTARTYSKIADLVQRHNKAKLVFLRALFFLALQGIVASYRYKDSDFKYGSYKVPVYDKKEIEVNSYVCEDCGYISDYDWTSNSGVSGSLDNDNNNSGSQMEETEEESGQGDDGQSQETESALADATASAKQQPFEYDPSDGINSCPQCKSIDKPKLETKKEEIPIKLREEDYPKTRAKVDIFGPLNFKVSYYARNQDECTYLILYGDLGKDAVAASYPDLAEEVINERLESTDRFSRSAYITGMEEVEERHLVTVKKVWLRPAAFYREEDEGKRERLLKKYPKGARVTLIGRDLFAGAEEEKFDDRWTIGQAGISNLIHCDPILRPLVSIQEMRNQLVNLIYETINHGIPSEFADPETINFDTYGRFEAVPGYIYKAKPKRPGDSLGNSFYTSSRSMLSREVALFLKQLDQDAQFCIGSFPSIYGGPSEGKSRTFAEYAASRQMALQRLSIVWTFLTDWWMRTIEGLVLMYKECVVEDERYVKFENGNYINVFIKQSEMQGKVGGVEPEGSETFPISLTQIKDLILKLMELNNEYVNSVIYNPDNARIIQEAFALTQLKVPGEAQRIKQSGEINELLKSPPISPVQSTIPIELQIDDHAVHINTLKVFLVEQQGLEEKRSNPEGYANCVAHLIEHENAIKMLTMQAGGGGTPLGAAPQTNQGVREE